jgi:hypothetical protein
MVTSFEMTISQLEVARDICKSMLKNEPTKGSVLAASQQIQQVLMHLNDLNESYEVIKKRARLL